MYARELQSWNTLSGRTDNCIANIQNAMKHGLKNKAAGFLMTDWGDHGHHQYPSISWLGIFAGGAYSWCMESNKHANIATAIDLLITHSNSGIGAYLFDFGNIYKTFEYVEHNCTLFNKILFTPLNDIPQFMEKVSVDEINKALNKLLELRSRLLIISPDIEDGTIIIAELKNASYMLECGLKKMLIMKGQKIDIQSLKQLMRHVIGKYDELWLKRNRPGGLNESSGKLRNILEDIA